MALQWEVLISVGNLYRSARYSRYNTNNKTIKVYLKLKGATMRPLDAKKGLLIYA